MNTAIKTMITAVVCLALSSCASIIHGPNQTVDLTSQPLGATVTIDGKQYGTTPKAIELRRKGRLKDELSTKKEYAVKLEMNGYMPYEIKIKREMDGWYLGNLLFGGLIGLIVDAANGSMYKLTPDQVIAQMGRVTAMNDDMDGKLYIGVTLTPDPAWERIGTLRKAE